MSEPKKELSKAVCVESKEDSTSYEIEMPPYLPNGIGCHLKEGDLSIAQDMIDTVIDTNSNIDEQKRMVDLVFRFVHRIGGLELEVRQDKIEIHNLMREVKELDQHLNPVFEGQPYGDGLNLGSEHDQSPAG